MAGEGIIIRKAIIHILDAGLGMPVLSDTELSLSPDLNDFIRALLGRVLSGDDLKTCVFEEASSEVYQQIQNFSEDNLVVVSKTLAETLYQIMNQNIAIPSADLLVVTFQMEGEQQLALLKLNYKESYVHTTKDEAGENKNELIKYYAALPSSSTRLSEAVIINLTDYQVRVLEKKYEVNGKKVNYLSELFLKCHAKMSSKAKLSTLTKTVEQINKKHFEDDIDIRMKAKSVLKEELNEEGAVMVERVSEKIYGEKPEIKEEFEEKLEKYNLKTARIEPQSERTVKKFEKQFLKTDTGIEINIPTDQYDDISKVEFITNPDGTISVLIKNINHITTK